MAEWKKVIVSGSQAELNSLDLKGSSGNLVVEGNTTLGNTTADTTQITGSTDISGSLRVDGTLTVTGDTLQEDLRTTGVTRLGNDMGDKTEITGSLNVTGSTNLTGDFTGVADTKYAFGFKGLSKEINFESGFMEIKGHISGQTLAQFRNGSNNLLGELNNQSDGLNLLLKDDGSDSISFSAAGTNGSFHNPNLHIGGTAVQSDAKFKVTGNANITSHITASGNISASGVAGPSGHVFGLPNASSGNGLGRLTLGGTGISMQLLDIANGNGFVMKGATGGTEVAALKVVGTNAGRLVLSDENTARIELSANTDAGSFIQDPLAIGAAAVDTNNTLSVTGNIKATTGITASYLTNDNILVAGAAGEVESSGVTWNGSTLDVGAGNITSTGNLTIADAKINGDLTVAGTASFENTENLKVTDRFISLASGSTGAGDGGIVIQQAATGLGEVFGFDNANGGRWGLLASFDPTASLFTPTDFMVTTTKDTSDPSADPTYGGSTGHGNMHVNTSTGDIFIYA